jgi:hypothetical protein
MNFSFTLSYKLTDIDSDQDELVERLCEAGCDDAVVGIGTPGWIALDFTREAESAFDAVISAMADVQRAMPTAQLIEAGPDIVGLTDIAEITGVTRQNMRKLALSNSNGFPVPIHAGTTSYWHLADVLRWLLTRGEYKIAAGILDVAAVAKHINIGKALSHAEQSMLNKVLPLLG